MNNNKSFVGFRPIPYQLSYYITKNKVYKLICPEAFSNSILSGTDEQQTHLKNTDEVVAERTKPALQLYLVCSVLRNGKDTAIYMVSMYFIYIRILAILLLHSCYIFHEGSYTWSSFRNKG